MRRYTPSCERYCISSSESRGWSAIFSPSAMMRATLPTNSSTSRGVTTNSPNPWQDIFPISNTKTSVASSTFNLTIPGQFRTVADVDFTNTTNSTLTDLSITAGGSTISLTGLSLLINATVHIFHDEKGLLKITASRDSTTISAYNYRTAASDDDLYVDPGKQEISMTANVAGTLTVSVRGRYA